MSAMFSPSKEVSWWKPNPVPLSFIKQHFEGLNCPLVRILEAENQSMDFQVCQTAIQEMVDKTTNKSEDEYLRCVLKELLQNKKITFCNYKVNLNASRPLCITLKLINDMQSLMHDECQFYKDVIVKDDLEIIELASFTVGQSSNNEWQIIRRQRISSTNAHKILRRRNNDYETLAHLMLHSPKFTNENMLYGLRAENCARQQFSFNTGLRIVECGVLISNSHPWLCASPDGIIVNKENEFSLLEIKSPSSRKGQEIIDFKIHKSFVPYLECSENNTVSLKEGHMYYTQIQVAMFVAHLTSCHFCIYSSKQNIVVLVNRDENFLSECIPKLSIFYFDFYL